MDQRSRIEAKRCCSFPSIAASTSLRRARTGGTVVVQYTQVSARPGVLPFAVTLGSPADRVTDETAAVTFLDPAHRLLTTPNRITPADFDEWGQERALYMPRTFAPAWRALFEMHDPGEAPNRGGLLVAPLGKGTFIYTTLSFFRQLPGGNPGAARLFEGAEILPLQVFDQRHFQRVAVAELAHQHRNLVQLRLLRRTPAPLARDQLILPRLRFERPHKHRL